MAEAATTQKNNAYSCRRNELKYVLLTFSYFSLLESQRRDFVMQREPSTENAHADTLQNDAFRSLLTLKSTMNFKIHPGGAGRK